MTPVDDGRGGFETSPYGAAPESATPDANAPQGSADSADLADHIARLERLVERELAAEEAVQAELGTLPRSRPEAEKTARILANLTQTLHVLQRLRASLPAETPPNDKPDDDDDMPRDIDEFRHALARRIEAWAAGQISRGDGAGDSGANVVEEIQ